VERIEYAQYVDGGSSVLAIVGEIGAGSEDALQRRITEWLASVGSNRALLDLSGVRSIDSRGVRVIIEAQERRHPSWWPLELRDMSPTVARLIDVVRAAPPDHDDSS
jgi:anti-anti-sigma factor